MILSFFGRTVKGTLEMQRNRMGLGMGTVTMKKNKRQDSIDFCCDSFSLHFKGTVWSFGRKYNFTVSIRQRKFSHFHVVHFKS